MVPWHGKGVIREGLLTAREAMQDAGLTWKAVKQPMFVVVNGEYKKVEDSVAIMRDSDNRQLGVVGDGYEPFQPSDCFSFADSLTQLKDEACYTTAGSLMYGKRIFLCIKIAGDLRILNSDDTIQKYLVLANSFDGSLRLTTLVTSVRVVCNNTLRAAVQSADKIFRIKHSKKMGSKVAEARETLGLLNKWYEEFNQKCNALASKQVSVAEVNAFYAKLFNTEGMKAEDINTRTKNAIDACKELFETGKGSQLITSKGTMWGLVNSVTDYSDHSRTTRQTSNFETEGEARMNASLFGTGEVLKTAAFENALQMVVGFA